MSLSNHSVNRCGHCGLYYVGGICSCNYQNQGIAVNPNQGYTITGNSGLVNSNGYVTISGSSFIVRDALGAIIEPKEEEPEF